MEKYLLVQGMEYLRQSVYWLHYLHSVLLKHNFLSHEISSFFFNSNDQRCVSFSPLLIHITKQCSPVRVFIPRSTVAIYSVQGLCLPGDLFSLGFPTKMLEAFLVSR